MGWHRLLDGIVALDSIAYSIRWRRLLDGIAFEGIATATGIPK